LAGVFEFILKRGTLLFLANVFGDGALSLTDEGCSLPSLAHFGTVPRFRKFDRASVK
jgi:hypothetical protein